MHTRQFVLVILLLSACLINGQVLQPISASILPADDGIRVAVAAHLSVYPPPFSSTLYLEDDTMRFQACYFTTGIFGQTFWARWETVFIPADQLRGCQLVVDFNEVGNFTSSAIDTIPRATYGPFTVCSVGLEELVHEAFRLGPNPFLDHVVIHSETAANVVVECIDPTGRMVYSKNRLFNQGANILVFPDLASSLYIVRIRSTEATWQRVVVKE